MSDKVYLVESSELPRPLIIDHELHVGDRISSPMDLPVPGEQPVKAGDVLTIVSVYQDGASYTIVLESGGKSLKIHAHITAKMIVSKGASERPVYKELDVVHLTKDFDTKRGIVKKGTTATILQVFAGGEAYQVEFEGEHEPPETVKSDYLS